jgi:hypothetical protein
MTNRSGGSAAGWRKGGDVATMKQAFIAIRFAAIC